MLPVRTQKAIPKGSVKKAMKYLSSINAEAPINMGDIIVKNILNTGIDVIASRSVEVEKSE